MTILWGNKLMKKFVTALAIMTGSTASLLMGTKAALSASFNWSYTTGDENVYSGMLDGDIQEDGNTINVTSVFMSQLNGMDLPETPIILSSDTMLGSTGVVSLDGTTMDLGACANTDCFTGIFIGDLGLAEGTIAFITSLDFGGADEEFNAENWTIEEKAIVSPPSVPEPSLTLTLVGLGLFSLVKTSKKKH